MAGDGSKNIPLLNSRNRQPFGQRLDRTPAFVIGMRDEYRAPVPVLVGLRAWQEDFHASGQVRDVLHFDRDQLGSAHGTGKAHLQ